MVLAGKRIGLLTAWASGAGGGVFEAVVAQAAMLRTLGAEPLVFALEEAGAAVDDARWDGTAIARAAVIGPPQIGYAPQLVSRLLAAELDLLHLHGIWMFPSGAGASWAVRTGRPYVISPHGMLDPWITARGRAKKAIARLGYERTSWRRAAFMHALTRQEADDIARESGRSDSMVIPNAAVAGIAPTPSAASGGSIVYIGRVHPKKNLEALVRGWQSLASAQRRGARLELAGWGDEVDVDALRDAIATAPDGIDYHGPVFGEAKAALLARADWVILPSLSEGLPMAILEAWADGTPAIMTDGCNLPEGFKAGAARRCGSDSAAIARAIAEALALPPADRQEYAHSARALASARFSPRVIALQWEEAYGSALGTRS